MWQSIKTAPRDGTPILVVIKGNHPVFDQPFIPDVLEWHKDYGWWREDWESEPSNFKPTHWMPLPDAPL